MKLAYHCTKPGLPGFLANVQSDRQGTPEETGTSLGAGSSF